MENEIRTWLADIKEAIEEINFFLPDKRDFFKFRNDLKTKRAIERNIGIIGEAVNRILKVDPKIEIKNSRKIVDTRNRIIHGYDSVSEEIIWSIVVRDLPKLENEIHALLKDVG
ncbi:MAG: HepT-like ribonuclease domain-containing protein [Cyclobacteriaceae bacterium]